VLRGYYLCVKGILPMCQGDITDNTKYKRRSKIVPLGGVQRQEFFLSASVIIPFSPFMQQGFNLLEGVPHGGRVLAVNGLH